MRCSITNKGVLFGNRVSKSNVRTKRKFKNNVKKYKLFSESTGKFYRLKLSRKSIRTIENAGGLDRFIQTKPKLVKDASPEFNQVKKAILQNNNEKSRITEGA